MKKKMYKAKKHWVVAGVTSASLFLAPTVLAQEAAPATAVVVDETTGGSENVTPQPTTDVNGTAETMDSSESSNLSAEATISAVESQSLDYSEIGSREATVSSDSSASASASVATVSSTVSGTADVNTSRTLARAATNPIVTSASMAASAPITPKEPVTKTVTGKTLSLQYNGPIASNEKIQYAIWGEAGGRNDLKWYTADISGAAYIDLSKHKEYGLYNVHTYKNVSGKMVGIEGGKVTVARPWITPIVKKVSSDHYVVRLEQLPSSLSQVKVPVWSDNQGQDDLKWYRANQVSSGIYEAHIYTANHKNSYGKYHIHAYAQSAITGKSLGIGTGSFIREDMRALSPATVVISHKTATTATVSVSGSVDSKVIRRVLVAACSNNGGQDDLKWYQTAVTNQKAQITVDMRDLSNTTDDYTIHVYTDYADGSRIGTDLGKHRFTKPSVQQTVSAKLATNGLELAVKSDLVKNYNKVKIAVWSEADGQDDIKWYAADSSGKALALYGNHKSSGLFHIHAYSFETGKAVFVAKATITVERLPSKTGKVMVSAVDTSNYTFATTITEASHKSGIKAVKVAVWSERNGQDDIEWYDAFKQKDGSYKAITHLSTHEYVNGKYQIHVYYDLLTGKSEGLVATSTTVVTPAPGTTVKPFEKKAAVAKGTSVALMSSASQGNYAKVNKIIYLDAGHGGADPGATYAGITEKSLNLKMQSLVRSKLERLGYKVITTRDTDAYLDLLPRSKKANQSIADLFVSIHFNASTSGRANGIETYYYQYYPEYQPAINKTYHNNAERLKRSAVLASAIQTAAVSATGAKDNGVLRETFAVLRETTAPAVLLELGYMSNYAERNRITNSAYQEKLAQAIVSGILSYYKTYSI